jgi:phage/plasmid-associated DNA primase
MCFNEIRGVDDISSGIERPLDLINHPHKFVDNPIRAHEKAVDISLQAKFSSKDNGVTFMGFLIKIFNEYGLFEFETPHSVKQEEREYLGENDVLGQFMDEFFEEIGEYSDCIKLNDIWSQIRSTREYSDQIGIRCSQALSQKLKNKGYTLSRVRVGIVLRYFKTKTSIWIPETSSENHSGVSVHV